MEWSKHATSLLIENYKAHQVLYNRQHPEYRIKKARVCALRIIMRSLESVRPRTTMSEIKAKINAVRTQFGYEYKKILNNPEYKPPMWWYPYIEFLKDYVMVQNKPGRFATETSKKDAAFENWNYYGYDDNNTWNNTFLKEEPKRSSSQRHFNNYDNTIEIYDSDFSMDEPEVEIKTEFDDIGTENHVKASQQDEHTVTHSYDEYSEIGSSQGGKRLRLQITDAKSIANPLALQTQISGEFSPSVVHFLNFVGSEISTIQDEAVMLDLKKKIISSIFEAKIVGVREYQLQT